MFWAGPRGLGTRLTRVARALTMPLLACKFLCLVPNPTS